MPEEDPTYFKKDSTFFKILAIGGSDPSGGAGIQADIKNFSALNLYAYTVITAVTAQNTIGVTTVYPLSAAIIKDQIRSVVADGRVSAVKVGMVGGAEVAAAVATALNLFPDIPIVIDPVIASHTGTPLTDDGGINLLRRTLIPMATVVTPNLAEAAELTGIDIGDAEAVRTAARKIWKMGAENVVIKGGHAADTADDVLFDGHKFTEYASKKLNVPSAHGSGCAFAAALTAALVRGAGVDEAVGFAKEFTLSAITGARRIGSGRPVADSSVC